jgi:hypothetical protein
MNIKYLEYFIEILDDPMYSEKSMDNKFHYSKVYKSVEDQISVSKHAIFVKNNKDEIISNAIMIGTRGGTGIHDHCYYILESSILICVSNFVFCLSLPELNLIWKLDVDWSSVFGIYKMNEDFITHGEIDISRINIKGKLVWQHSGSDIFVLPGSENSFKIIDNLVICKSWDGREYNFNYEGKIV